MCIFYERINVQGTAPMYIVSSFYSLFPDLVVRKADIELKSREEEIRFLNMEVCRYNNFIIKGISMQLNKVKHELQLLQKLEPQKESLTGQLKQAQAEVRLIPHSPKQYCYCTQLSQVHNHLTLLEKAMETDLSRARSLSGVDPNTGQLQVAMEKVLFHEYTILTVSSSIC